MSEHLKQLAETFSKMAAEGKQLNEMQTAHASSYITDHPFARAAIRDAAVRVAVESVEAILGSDSLADSVGCPEALVIVYRQIIYNCLNMIEEIERKIKDDEAAPTENPIPQ